MDILVALVTLAALVPLISVLYMVVRKGAGNFRWSMLWELPPAAGMDGGGFAMRWSARSSSSPSAPWSASPVGVLTAIFLTEYSLGSKSARMIRFSRQDPQRASLDPRGVFIFGVLVATTRTFSVIAGGLALAILMLPIIILATEEALLRVPRFSARGLVSPSGANRTQTVLNITLPAAGSTIITGVMLAVARAAGETAPIIFTALFTSYWIGSLREPTASMAVPHL